MQRDPDSLALGPHELLAQVRAAPWKFGFIALLRRFGAMHPRQPRIGTASRPQQETLRLGQTAALAFAPRELAELVLPEAASDPTRSNAPLQRHGNNAALPLLRVYGLGLLGPNGPLPLHYTELVRDRTENHHDSTLADFLDLFHHRYLTHMYRAWAQSQAAAGLDRSDDETFSRYVARLTGHDPLEIRDSALPSHARLAASAHLSPEARHPDGLVATLARYFKVPVELQEFVLHWIRIEAEDQTHLGQARHSSMVGLGAIAGEMVADRQNKFRLVIGPLNLQQYLRFTPQGQDMRVLVEWVRAFVGYEFVWEVELRICTDNAPPARLGAAHRLGWSTWLGDSAATAGTTSAGLNGAVRTGFAVGMVFEPESYVATLVGPATRATPHSPSGRFAAAPA